MIGQTETGNGVTVSPAREMREEGRESREERAWKDTGQDTGTGATFSIAMSERARSGPQEKPDHPNGEETPRVIVNPSVVAILLTHFQATVRTLTTHLAE